MTQAEIIDRLTAVLQHATDGLVLTDRDGLISFASPYAEMLLGAATPGGLVGTSGSTLLHPDDIEQHGPRLSPQLRVPGATVQYEGRIRGADGRWVWAEITMTNLFDDPRVGGFVTNFRDITERRYAAAQRGAVAEFGLWALRGASVPELTQRAVDLLVEFLGADAAVITQREPNGDLIVRASSGWPMDILGRTFAVSANSPGARRLVTESLESPVVVPDYADEPAFLGGEVLEAAGLRSSVGVAIRGDHGPWGFLAALSRRPAQSTTADTAFVQALSNVLASALERGRAEHELAHQALHDPLTGLPNRALLHDRLELGLAACGRSAGSTLVVQIIDLDNFKRVNDTLGHNAGDDLLREVARRLQATVRAGDTVARFGGDEFVVVSEARIGSEDPCVLAERILAALRRPYQIWGGEHFVTASIGIATSNHESSTADSLLRDADAVMYEAKNRGRNRYAIFDRSLRTSLMTRAELEQDLRHALARGELLVLYQPVVDSTSGEVIGSEALLRWRHARRGVLAPDQFIRTAEDTGMILPIGRWVLQQACAQLAAWQRDHHRSDLGVSVNLSPRQLADPELLPTIQNALSSAGLEPSSLRLEITETMIVEDITRAESTVAAISRLGVGLIIDDFGTGYSSLSYLKRLPIVCIKIDRSFVTDICTNPADQAIVASTAELAQRLGICAVAEGVETGDQLTMVRDLGCTLIQGYYYATPLEPTELERRLDDFATRTGRTA